jgi:hypothetical protein
VPGSVPVLKPREVVALLERLGFIEVRQRGSHRQYSMPMDAARRYRSMAVAIFRRSSSARSRVTSV